MIEKPPTLSTKEADVMSVLWSEDTALTASQIAEAGNLKLNTVKVALQNLLKKNYIEIAAVVYSKTVLSRSYNYLISAEEYAAEQLNDMKKNSFSFSTLHFMEQLVKNDSKKLETLNELEEAIKKLKEEN